VTIRHGLLAFFAGLLSIQGCEDAIPTSTDGDLLPVEAVTVELRLPFSEFATDFQLFDGFGSTSILPSLVLAHEWEGTVEARSLFRFLDLPLTIFVFPPGSNTTVADSLFVPVSGEVALELDTLEVRGLPPFLLEAGVTQTPWHPPSVDWDFAVDTLGAQVPWPEPGAGPVAFAGQGEWDPNADGGGGGSESDPPLITRATIPLDSAGVTALLDTTVVGRGVRVSSLSPESRFRVRSAELVVRVRSSVNPDTIVAITVGVRSVALLQDPPPSLDPAAFPIGGAPAVRATFRFDLPESVPGSPAVCALVTCPVELLAERLVYAGLEFYTHEVIPTGLRPIQETVIELRPVLSPESLPRSPLGFPLACPSGECAMTLPSTVIEEDFFTSELGTRVDLPMTRYVRDLLRDDGSSATPVPSTLVLMNGVDPQTLLELRPLQYSTFWGPGTELEPTLRLVLTVASGVSPP
jgi:hypothetical protein